MESPSTQPSQPVPSDVNAMVVPTNTEVLTDDNTMTVSGDIAQPLTEFTPFPKLPLELQQEIFEHALAHTLPNQNRGHRFLEVWADVEETNEEFELHLGASVGFRTNRYRFFLDERVQSMRFSPNSAVLGQVCKESRKVLLRYLPHVISDLLWKYKFDGNVRLRFDDATVVLIEDFWELLRDDSCPTLTIDKRYRLSSDWCRIRRLACDYLAFFPKASNVYSPENVLRVVNMLTSFRYLEVFIVGFEEPLKPEEVKECVALVDDLQKALVNQWERLQPTCNTPSVKVYGLGIEDGYEAGHRKTEYDDLRLRLSALSWL